MTSLPKTMRAVVLKEPYKFVIEDRPTPIIEREDEAIIEVYQSGLCGSDLHWYRGHQPLPYDFILGHETLGKVVQVGKDVKKFKPGDIVVVPFSTSCGSCFYCDMDYTSRCVKAMNFGNPILPGGQAEYFKLHLADTTLFHVPSDLPLELMVLMTDILPIGYSTARNARRLADEDRKEASMGKRGVCVVIGCGPVGLCAITSATTMFEKVYATDLATHRLEAATRHGAVALPYDALKKEVLAATEGRGADAVLEVVGHVSALRNAMDIARPYGVVSSCGVHTHETTLDGVALYGKNLRFQFGRCSVRTFFPAALDVLRNNQGLFSSFVENKIGFDQAEEFYKLFEANKVAKTVFSIKS